MRGAVVEIRASRAASGSRAVAHDAYRRLPTLLPGRPRIMGILNVTPDSFSDGGRWLNVDDAIRHAEQMVLDGAELIDIGGESTRPGAPPVGVDEERRRVIPVIRRLARRLRVPLSIDTSKAEVARDALEAGASLVNDVTALGGDPAMAAVVGRAGVPIILMHMRGTPRTMQRRPRYHDVGDDVCHFLRRALDDAQRRGIRPDRILIDPGLGFGKTVTHNLQLLRYLPRLATLGRPIVVGPSRKSFIGVVTGADLSERLPGTLACVAQAALGGAAIVRVHDVKAVRQFLAMWQALGRA